MSSFCGGGGEGSRGGEGGGGREGSLLGGCGRGEGGRVEGSAVQQSRSQRTVRSLSERTLPRGERAATSITHLMGGGTAGGSEVGCQAAATALQVGNGHVHN